MGMFDYLRLDFSLPDGPQPPDGTIFQTKDITDGLNTFLITEKGLLWLLKKGPDGGMFLDRPWPYHGDIVFYEFKDHTEEWWEFTARFSENVCVRIWLSEHRTRDERQRSHNIDKLDDARRKSQTRTVRPGN